MIRLILVGILLLLSLTFFLQNQDQEVTFRYWWFGVQTAATPIYKPILSAFGLGLLVASVLLFPAWVRGRIELRRKTKALQEAEADLDRLRKAIERTPHQTGAAPPAMSGEELPDD